MDKDIIDTVADFYDVNQDFDYFNTKLASRIICSHCKDKIVLEIGCADGVMTEDLVKVCRELIIVEPSAAYSKKIHQRFPSVKIYNCFLEEVKDEVRFEVIVMASLLHHIKETAQFLELVKKFLNPGGIVLATVPNMTSLHRRIGAKASLLKDEYSDSERNRKLHQFGRFDKQSFEAVFRASGYDVMESFGYMLKPFSSEQMMSLKLDWNVINALFEIGRENQHLASQLFIKAGIGNDQ